MESATRSRVWGHRRAKPFCCRGKTREPRTLLRPGMQECVSFLKENVKAAAQLLHATVGGELVQIGIEIHRHENRVSAER